MYEDFANGLNNSQNRKPGSNEIANLIRKEIISGKLSYPQRLPSERILAEKYLVARGTIRQGLMLLEKDNLITIKAGSGAYISKINNSPQNQIINNARPLELIDTRFALEPHICRLAILHATQNDLDTADELLNRMDYSTNSIEEFSMYDSSFHNLLAESTNNPLLISMFNQVNSVRNQEKWSLMRKLTLNEKAIRLYNSQHRLILDAIKLRDPDKASFLMKEHLESARLSLTRAASA